MIVTREKDLILAFAMFLAATTMTCFAKVANSEQIRLERVCSTYGRDLPRLLDSWGYKKAVERKKAGTLNPNSRELLEKADWMRGAMHLAKCKSIP